MAGLKSYGKDVRSIFQLLGYKEDNITLSISWALTQCEQLTREIVKDLLGINITNFDKVEVRNQEIAKGNGRTDIELKDDTTFYIIFEAKRGWNLPDSKQLLMYMDRPEFKNSKVKHKMIVSMSECSKAYADLYLPFKQINGVPIRHLSWKDTYLLADKVRKTSNHRQTHLLDELMEYLKGVMTMQDKKSNMVYVVSLGSGKPNGCNVTWIDIVRQTNQYFHVIGENGWPKEPPNYLGVRYHGQLQAIYYIEDYVVTDNLNKQIPQMPDIVDPFNSFVYKLGPAIIPPKAVMNGKVYPNGRIWAMLDTLLTSDSVSEARDITQKRLL